MFAIGDNATRKAVVPALVVMVFTVLAGCGTVAQGATGTPSATFAASPSPYTAQVIWQGQVMQLRRLSQPIAIQELPDAVFQGRANNFQTSDPVYACLVGSSLNVYVAPSQFPGQYVVSGTCPGGAETTWDFPAPPNT
jgi:hypothetical protein